MIEREHKDRLFRYIFSREEHKDWTLSLYNAMNGTSYDYPSEIELTTMEDVLYMGMKNDVSFLLHWVAAIMEQQSTYNPNMPVRMLGYVGKLYGKYLEKLGKQKYSSKLIPLPAPRLVVFYNGPDTMPDEMTLRLSDAFPEGVKGDIEVEVRMLNINKGHNRALLEACKPLSEYAWFIDTIRENQSEGMETEDAVDTALAAMPEDYLLKPFLMGHKAEVKDMYLTEYNEAEAMEMRYEEGVEHGIEQGIQLGKEQGIQLGKEQTIKDMALKMFRSGKFALEEIMELSGLDANELNALAAQ